MAKAIITIEASASFTDDAPTLQILVEGPVFSSSVVTAITGVGSDILSFTIDFPGSFPSSLSFRFNDGLAEAGRKITIESVRINGQAINTAVDLSDTELDHNEQAVVNIGNTDHLYTDIAPNYRDEPSSAGWTATYTGTGGDDNKNGSSNNEVMLGQGGNDILRGHGGDDKIAGGAGADRLYGGSGDDIIIGEGQDDVIVGQEGNDLLYGGDGDDSVLGDDGDDVLSGGIGNDTLVGGDGYDQIFGEDGNDYIYAGNDDDVVYGDAGNDSISGGDGNDIIYGGDNNDMISGDSGDDILYGDSGSDQIAGMGGDDTIYGGDQDDALAGNDGNDTIYGGNHNDYIFGDDGNDILNGDGGIDTLLGGSGADTLNGGAGNDLLHGHALSILDASLILFNNPSVTFNPATNSFYQLVSTNVTFNGAQGVAGSMYINGVEGHLVTIGDAVENAFVQTLAGGNTIWINALDSGSEGEWRWAGGNEDGQVFYDGGTSISGIYQNWTGGFTDNNAQDAAYMQANGFWNDDSATNTRYYVVEWDGADFADDNAVDTLNGGDNDDQLFGHGGNDVLNGDAGSDYLAGGAGNDDMSGGADNDYIRDYEGANEFYGDGGNDTLDARFQTAIPSLADQISNILTENPALSYSAVTGNFYTLVTGNFNFSQAITGAANYLVNGVGGHLVTITSTEENDLVAALRLGNTIWLGASDDTATTGDAEGEWYWVDGPEAGTKFWTGGLGGSVMPGMFAAWDAGEPNDYVGGEDWATMWQGGSMWNDDGPPNNNGFTADYMVEWEGGDLLVTPPAEPAQSVQYMEGGAGNDEIYGGNNNDTIYGDDAANTQTGDDYIEAGDGDDTVDGGQGTDTIYGGLGSDTLSGGDGNDTIYAAFAPASSAIPVSSTFDTDYDGFTYDEASVPWGGGDGAGMTIDDNFIAGDGYNAAGCIEIDFNTTGASTNSSGSFYITVNLATAMDAAQLSFAYRMHLDTGADANENIYLYADIDGTQYGTGGNSYVDVIEGNISEGTWAWQTVTLDIGALTTGSHTITLGGNYNQTTANDETGWIRFDDVVLSNDSSSASSDDDTATNILNGNDGDDVLHGSAGTDTLNGGNGDDELHSHSQSNVDLSAVQAILDANPGMVYLAATGNFYQYVNTTVTATQAFDLADDVFINGVAGHLITIGSQAENDMMESEIGAETWIGAFDVGNTGQWIWDTGPENGTQFWNGNNGGSAIPGVYSNWDTGAGEPNDNGPSQHIRMATDGLWLDNSEGNNYHYMIEWEGAAVLNTLTTILDEDFSTDGHGFSYSDGFGGGGPGGSDGGGVTVDESRETNDGDTANGSLEIEVNRTGTYNNASGNWSRTINVSEDMEYVQLSLSYRHWHATSNDNNEDSWVYIVFDGVQYGIDGTDNGFVSEALGTNGQTDTGWERITLNLGTLSAGNYNLAMGIYHDGANRNNEEAYVRFDDVQMVGVASSSLGGGGGPVTTLNGGAGADDLYASDGEDLFAFDYNGGDWSANPDTVYDFNEATGDSIDISDILDFYGITVNAGNVSTYVDISSGSGIRIDVDGAGAGGFSTVATFSGTTTVSDELTLLNNGDLIV